MFDFGRIFESFRGEVINYIYQLEIPVILSILVLTLYIFYSLNFFKKS